MPVTKILSKLHIIQTLLIGWLLPRNLSSNPWLEQSVNER
jgi:hypothetical protein